MFGLELFSHRLWWRQSWSVGLVLVRTLLGSADKVCEELVDITVIIYWHYLLYSNHLLTPFAIQKVFIAIIEYLYLVACSKFKRCVQNKPNQSYHSSSMATMNIRNIAWIEFKQGDHDDAQEITTLCKYIFNRKSLS